MPIPFGDAEACGAVVRSIEHQVGAFAQRSFRAHLGQGGGSAAVAVDGLAAGGDGSVPDPSGVVFAHDQAGLPLAVTLGVEVGAADVELVRSELAPPQLRADSLFGDQEPDHAGWI